MHFHFPYTSVQILWTLCFASHLVLLVVLLGRERHRRFPIFSFSILLMTLRLLFEELLVGRLPVLMLQSVLISMAAFSAILGVAVLAEMAARSFPGAPAKGWLIGAPATLLAAGLSLIYWGPWPKLADLAVHSRVDLLRFLQFVGQKADLLVDLLALFLLLAVVALGRRFKTGFRSHSTLILLGIAAQGALWLGIIAYWKVLTHSIQPGITREEYQHILDLGQKLFTANRIAMIVGVLWWIVVLWIDEPGAPAAALSAAEQSALPEAAVPTVAELAAPVSEAETSAE
jgi:hypothetical protein